MPLESVIMQRIRKFYEAAGSEDFTLTLKPTTKGQEPWYCSLTMFGGAVSYHAEGPTPQAAVDMTLALAEPDYYERAGHR